MDTKLKAEKSCAWAQRSSRNYFIFCLYVHLVKLCFEFQALAIPLPLHLKFT